MKNKTNNRWLNQCLCCGGSGLIQVLDLGVQPLANSYFEHTMQIGERFPLGLNVCNVCWHAQLSYCVDRSSIFRQYHYVSGTSRTLKRFFGWFANAVKKSLPRNPRILELAANDGSLVKEFLRLGISIVGIDPADNIIKAAQAAGLPIKCGYWPQASKLAEGSFDAIICMNVVAHVDNPKEFIDACREKLNPGGVLLLQTSQARMFSNAEFDTCYHEHISFFNTSSMGALAKSVGLELYDAIILKIHGDSPLFILGHHDFPPDLELWVQNLNQGEFAVCERLKQYENDVNIYNWSIYEIFRERAQETLAHLRSVVEEHRALGYQIVCVGAAAKGMTVLNAAQFKPDFLLDESPLKIGRVSAGLGVQVSPLEACSAVDSPALFVITAWNFAEELVKKLRCIGIPEGSRIFVYFPKSQFL